MGAEEAAQQRVGQLEQDADEVWCWRLEQFTVLGFTDEQAILLARSDADLSHARYLRSSGCSCTLAITILL